MNYSIDYLEKEVAPKLMLKANINNITALNIASKALQFKDYKDLKFTYSINRNNRIFDKNNLRKYPKYDLSNYGFFFSEHILSKELNIGDHEAVILKNSIDNTYYKEISLNHYDGNIGLSCSSTIEKGISNIRSNGAQMRIMAYWPLKFYFKHYDGISVSRSHSEGKHHIDALVCDSINFIEPAYFTDSSGMKELLEKMINAMLHDYNVLILGNVISHCLENYPWMEAFIFSKYEFVNLKLPASTFCSYGVFIPKKTNDRNFIENHSILTLLSQKSEPLSIEERIKNHRIKRKLTKAAMAGILGVNEKSIYNWEAGVFKPRDASLKLINKELL